MISARRAREADLDKVGFSAGGCAIYPRAGPHSRGHRAPSTPRRPREGGDPYAVSSPIEWCGQRILLTWTPELMGPRLRGDDAWRGRLSRRNIPGYWIPHFRGV